MVNTMTQKRATNYGRAIGGIPIRHDVIAMKMLLCEARARERSLLLTPGERRKADIKWRFVLTQVKEAERKGASPCEIRADLASRYPFQGMLTPQYLFNKELEKRGVVAEANSVIFSNSSRTSHASSKTSESSRNSSSEKSEKDD
ncbi:hypothetical protein DIPPA_14798 [Diplonema papillatum]|nr:hypothetical protein DIPPA_14798 [Diplonema papillatum]